MYSTHEFTRVPSSASYVKPCLFLCVTRRSGLLVPVRQPLSVLYPVGFVRVDFAGLSGGSPTAGEASAT